MKVIKPRLYTTSSIYPFASILLSKETAIFLLVQSIEPVKILKVKGGRSITNKILQGYN